MVKANILLNIAFSVNHKYKVEDYTLMRLGQILFYARSHMSINATELKDNHCIISLVIKMSKHLQSSLFSLSHKQVLNIVTWCHLCCDT